MSDVKDVLDMPAEVDFSHSQPNPYIGKVRRRITINIDGETLDYFKAESARTGIPYQTIINMYLSECRDQEKHLAFA